MIGLCKQSDRGKKGGGERRVIDNHQRRMTHVYYTDERRKRIKGKVGEQRDTVGHLGTIVTAWPKRNLQNHFAVRKRQKMATK